jgi:chromosome segregation ATPase
VIDNLLAPRVLDPYDVLCADFIMNPTQRKPARAEASTQGAVDTLPALEQAIEQVIARSDALIAIESAPLAEREALRRALEEAVARLNKIDESRAAEVVELRRLRDALRDQALTAMRAAIEQISAARKDAEDARRRWDEASAGLEASCKQAEELSAQLQALRADHDDLQKRAEQQAERERALQTAMQAANAQIAHIDAQLAEARDDARSAGDRLAQSQAALDEISARREALASELERVQAERDLARTSAADLKRRVESLEQEAATASRTIQDLRDELHATREQARAQQAAIVEQHDAFIISLTDEHEEKLAAANTRALQAEQTASESRARLEEVSLQVEVLVSERDEAKAARTELEQAVRRIEAGRDQARAKLAQAESERDELRAKVAQAESERDELRAKVEETSNLEQDLVAARARVLDLERQIVDRDKADSQRAPAVVGVEAAALSGRLRQEIDMLREELQHALAERDAAVTDALRIQKELDEARSGVGESSVERRSPSMMPEPLGDDHDIEELQRTIDRLERERDEAMHTLADIRVELTQAQDENRKLKGVIGLVDDAQLLLPVDDPQGHQRVSEPAPRARRSKAPPSSARRASSYFVSGEAIPEETIDGRRARRSTSPEPVPGGSRRRTRPK